MNYQKMRIDFMQKRGLTAPFVYKTGEVDVDGIEAELVNIDVEGSPIGFIKLVSPTGIERESALRIENGFAYFDIPKNEEGLYTVELTILNKKNKTHSGNIAIEVINSLSYDSEEYETLLDTITQHDAEYTSNENIRIENEKTRIETFDGIKTDFENLTAGKQLDSEVIIARNGRASLKDNIESKRSKSVLLTQSDLSTSSEAHKLTMNHLNDEVKAALAGTAPVAPSVADLSLNTEKYNYESVVYNRTDFLKAEYSNMITSGAEFTIGDTSTFSGWGTYFGTYSSVAKIEFKVRNRDTVPTTKVRVFVTEKDKAGTVLFKKDLVVNIGVGQTQTLSIELDKPIKNTSNSPLYLVVVTDKLSTGISTYTGIVPDGVTRGAVAYTTNGTIPESPATMATASGGVAQHILWHNVYQEQKLVLDDRVLKHLETKYSLDSTNADIINLPKTINAVVGDTLQLFYRGMIENVNPYNYDIRIVCSKGKQFKRYFEILPVSGDIGSYNFKVELRDSKGAILASKTVTLNVIAKKTSPSTVKNILCVGDSLTASGVWVNEFKRRLTGLGGDPVADSLTNINFIGTKTNNGDAKFEATGGWRYANYLAKDATNPFYDQATNTIDFSKYCEKNGFSGIDVVVILLGWNQSPADKSTAESWADVMTQATELTNLIKASYPNVKIIMPGIQLPSLNGGTGYDYGAIGGYSHSYALTRGVFGLNRALEKFVDGKTSFSFVHTSSQFDSENNMPQLAKKVNTRNSTTEMSGVNGVHPEAGGYLQIADAVYREFVKNAI